MLTPYIHNDNNTKKRNTIKPVYMICNVYKDMHKFVALIKKVLLENNASVDDILILFASVKQTSTTGEDNPVKLLCNKLSAYGYTIAIQFDNALDIDEKILKNKMWISNFHKVKGIERKHVFVFNFDSLYFKYYG